MVTRDTRDIICNTASMPRRRRRRLKLSRAQKIGLAILAVPLLYLAAALLGGLISLNRNWAEADKGVTVYLADNGIHTDLIVPADAAGVSFAALIRRDDMAAPPADARYLSFGMGERAVYLDTPTWADLTPRTVFHALVGGRRVMHVEWIADPSFAVRRLTLTPAEYRRLFSAIRGSFVTDAKGRPQRIDHPGYGPADAFYDGKGKASAINTCNQWTADTLRTAGVRVPLWSPFPTALTRRYRPL